MGNMKGAVAAGHQATAEAGAAILAEGGNAVDACLAAAFASWVTEAPLTGPGGGGFLLVHRARDRTTRLLDFYVSYPGDGAVSPPGEMETIEVDFSGGSSQLFRVGGASCAVPGAAVGLETAHRAYGSRPWARLIEPAIELARGGVELNESQAYLHDILHLILCLRKEGSAIFAPGGERLLTGDRLVQRDLGATLEVLAEEGASALTSGRLARQMVQHVRGVGGVFTEADLAQYRAIWRRPVRAEFGGNVFLSNPPPATGGALIAYGLVLLDRLGVRGGPGSAEETALLVEVMREQARIRERGFASLLYRGGLVRRLLSPASVEDGLDRIGQRHELPAVGAPGIMGTTHVSVIDDRGNAASLTASNGAGSGVVVPGTGVHLNNMVGEYELVPSRDPVPGRRLTSLMAPSLVLRRDRPRLVVGSAGSLRLHGAILQAVANVVRHGLPVDEAIARPRVHADGPVVHCEGGADPAQLDRLGRMGYELVRWGGRNLFFGGVSAVEAAPDGGLSAAGDPRRGGTGVVV
jgi:gamma-glutamyltranspeptidase / glutathione hydrolase